MESVKKLMNLATLLNLPFLILHRYSRQAIVCFALTFMLLPSYAAKGINGNELFRLTPTELSTTIAGYKELGVTWVRFDFDWSVMQPTPNTYDTTAFDNVVIQLGKANINILGIITYTPSWANGGQPSKFYPPTNPKTFGKFASYLAARYGPMGVHTWEIWNEPNLAQFWGPAADPNAYAALLRSAYPAIKRQDAKAVVVTGGLAQPYENAFDMDARRFLELIYANGAKSYFDAVGNHPYTSPRMPLEDSVNNWKKMYETQPSFLSIMAQYGDDKKKIWITEYGGPTNGTDKYGTVMDEIAQATMVDQSIRAAASYSWAGPIFWYNYKDFCPYSSSGSTECYYGLVRSDGTQKPAYGYFRNASN